MPPDPMDEVDSVSSGLRDFVQRQLFAWRDMRRLFYGEDGHLTKAALRWLDRLAGDNFVASSTFHEDPREMARREGQRELALKIIASVKLDPMRLKRAIEQMEDIDHE